LWKARRPFGERFEREARAISALNHPHICALHDIGGHDGEGYLVLEYVEGSPLKGPLPLDQALKYAAQICGALDAAHRKGIIHRDLKPENILLTYSIASFPGTADTQRAHRKAESHANDVASAEEEVEVPGEF
jgi:serine/threonine protein kinase